MAWVVLTGLAAWGAGQIEGWGHTRFILMETHDKLALLAVPLMSLHLIQRFPRFLPRRSPLEMPRPTQGERQE